MMERILILLLVLIGLSIQGCDLRPDKTTDIAVQEIASPVKTGGEPNLFVSSNGQTYLSWIEYLNDTTHSLLFSRLLNNKWSDPIKVAHGSDWFVNWADFPSLVSFSGNPKNIAAHWLQKSGDGTFDYEIQISISADGGYSWPYSFVPHKDEVAAEHGFVTLTPLKNERILATWLDGRNTKNAGEQKNHSAHGGAMTLRTAEFDVDGNLFEEKELDNRVCDCCQTDAAITSLGPVVVYRDRSEKEIRDISIVRKVDGQWTVPKKIHNDNWEIAGCPVNGPAIIAENDLVAIAWFTGSERKNKINVVFSKDSGKTFSNPFQIDDGNPIGRVDLELVSPETVLVSWIEQTDNSGEIRLAKVNIENGKIGESFTAIKIGISRQSGFPRLKKLNDNYLITWVAIDSIKTAKTALLTI